MKLSEQSDIYSAILPGAGQVYNKKYWKVPIVYAASGYSGICFLLTIKTGITNCQYALTVCINLANNGSRR